jgi:hypothetical protein
MPGQVRAEGIPSMQVGDGSVVKVEIDSSVNIGKIKGDIVQNKTISNTSNQVINITNKESIISALTGSSRKEVDAIERDFSEASKTASTLIAFVNKQIAAIESADGTETRSAGFKARYATGIQALSLLESQAPFQSANASRLKKELVKAYAEATAKNQNASDPFMWSLMRAVMSGEAHRISEAIQNLKPLEKKVLICFCGFLVLIPLIISIFSLPSLIRQKYQEAALGEDSAEPSEKTAIDSRLAGKWIGIDNGVTLSVDFIESGHLFVDDLKGNRMGAKFKGNGRGSIMILNPNEGWERSELVFENQDTLSLMGKVSKFGPNNTLKLVRDTGKARAELASKNLQREIAEDAKRDKLQAAMMRLIGKWTSKDGDTIVEFTNNTCVLYSQSHNISGESKIINSKEIVNNLLELKIDYDAFTFDFVSTDEFAATNRVGGKYNARTGQFRPFSLLQGKFVKGLPANNLGVTSVDKSNNGKMKQTGFGPNLAPMFLPDPEIVAPGGSPPNAK